MFPTLGYLINYFLGTSITLGFPTFGFIVAMSFLSAAFVLKSEIIRKEKLGIFKSVYYKETIGAPASLGELLYNVIFGFILGAKLGLLITDSQTFLAHPQQAIISTQGNLLFGIIGAIALTAYVYWDKKRKALPTPKVEDKKLSAGELVVNITMIAALSGISGAKLFHLLEYWDEFMAAPMEQLLSFAGLTFYGGLICGFLAVGYYCRKKGLGFVHVCDSAAPALILAYGIGRLGCQLAGDGDWGVINSAYRYDYNTKSYVEVPADRIETDKAIYAEYYNMTFGSVENAHHLYYKKPAFLSFLPDVAFAQSYPNNVNNDGIYIAGCEGEYCARLPLPVIPTPIYETSMAVLIFLILWSLRRKFKRPGLMFSVYLIFNGLERFTIEQFRVNSEYNILGGVTQAEIISFTLIAIGILGIFLTKKFQSTLEKI